MPAIGQALSLEVLADIAEGIARAKAAALLQNDFTIR